MTLDEGRGRLLLRSRAGRMFLVVALVDSAGTGIYLAGSVLFLTRTVGLSPAQLGLGLAACAITGFLASVPAGMVADRVGAKRTLIALQLWRGAWFVAFAFVTTFPQFVAVSVLLGLADRAVGPVTQAVVGAAVDEGPSRVRLLALMRSIRNIGFGLGAALATVLISVDQPAVYRGLMLANAASFFLAVAVLHRVRLVSRPESRKRRPLFGGERAFGDGPYLVLSGLNGVLTLHMTLLSVGLPLWTAEHTAAPLWVVGTMVVLNTCLAVLLQVWAARGCEDPQVAARRTGWAGVALAGCVLMLPVTARLGPVTATALLLLAAVLLTLGELWQSGAAWGLSYDLAPADYRAEYLSVFGLGRSLQEAAGPVIVAALVFASPDLGWPLLAAVFLAAGLATPSVAERMIRHRHSTSVAAEVN